MFYLTCTAITSVELAHYGVSRAKDWVSVGCGTRCSKTQKLLTLSICAYSTRIYENILNALCFEDRELS